MRRSAELIHPAIDSSPRFAVLAVERFGDPQIAPVNRHAERVPDRAGPQRDFFPMWPFRRNFGDLRFIFVNYFRPGGSRDSSNQDTDGEQRCEYVACLGHFGAFFPSGVVHACQLECCVAYAGSPEGT